MGSCSCAAPALPGLQTVTFVRSLSFAMRFRARCSALFSSCRPLPRPRTGTTGSVPAIPCGTWVACISSPRYAGSSCNSTTASTTYQLPPGQLLRFPISWLRIEPAPARVLSVRGRSNCPAPMAAPRALLAGEQLRIGDTVQTEGDSSVTLEFADASACSCAGIPGCAWTSSAVTATPAWSIPACASSRAAPATG